jgi:hypothetical protein
LLKATAQKQCALTGEILHPKPTGYRPQRIVQDGFPAIQFPEIPHF